MKWLVVCLMLPLTIRAQFSTEKMNVFFEEASAILSNSELERLKTFAKSWTIVNGSTISIYGYCDEIGSKSYNDDLSQRRADYIKNQLISYSIPWQLIKITEGRGEFVGDNNISNRRVLVVFKKVAKRKKNSFEGVVVGDKIRLSDIKFVGGSSEPLAQSKKVLDSLSVELAKTSFNFEIQGHLHTLNGLPDAKEAVDKLTNKANLSEARAKVVYDHFVMQGVDSSRITYKGYKGMYPIGPEGSLNRRVEILIIE